MSPPPPGGPQGPRRSRGEFLRGGLRHLASAAASLASAAAERVAGRWIRPPGALDELDFLTHCTRCGACADACPHDAILTLEGGVAGLHHGTPHLDPARRPCHLCEDLPCIAACPEGALLPTSPADVRLALARIHRQTCLAWAGDPCEACIHACPWPGDAIYAEVGTDHVFIDPDRCTGCGLCALHCPTDPASISFTRHPR